MRISAEEDVEARFNELLEASLKEEPQIVTAQGVEVAVLVAVEEGSRLTAPVHPTLKELLLAEEGRAEIPLPTRRRWHRRPPVAFE